MTIEPVEQPYPLLDAGAAQPIWVTDQRALVELCEQWSQEPLLTIDTEFIRFDTFYPVPGLIQLADRQHCYLIDPLAIDDMSALIALLVNPAVLKVFHACSEDLELFRNSYGVVPTPLFDTQIAAAFANWGFSMGLQRLVKHALNIDLGKAQTTSDWLQRPLTPEQVHYAALDVAYLGNIAVRLMQELKQLGRLGWVLEESALLADSSRDADPTGQEYYRRFTQLNVNSDEALAACRDLAAWREQACRARNLCRPKVLRNEVILDIIQQWPSTLEELSSIKDMRRSAVQEDGQAILAVLKEAKVSAEENPPKQIHLPAHVYRSKELKKLLSLAREVAKRENILPEILARRKDVEKLINSKSEEGAYQLPRTLRGWRKALVGDLMLSHLQSFDNESD